MNYRNPTFGVFAIAVILVVVVSIGLVANYMNTTRLSAIEGLSLESHLDRVAYGTLISDNRYMDFNGAKAEEITNYLRNIKVYKSAISKSRNIDRDNTNQVHFVFRGFLDNGDMGNMYFNFSNDFSEVWVDNGVKPSLSYRVKKPGEVKDFFERQFGSVTLAMEIGSEEELWKARTQYIGDNNAVGTIISLLPVPEGLQYDLFGLHTNERPYEIEIVYSTTFKTLKQYAGGEKDIGDLLGKNALLLLALVNNADQIKVRLTEENHKKGITLTDENNEVEFINERSWEDYTVGEDIRNFAVSPEKLQELIDFSISNEKN